MEKNLIKPHHEGGSQAFITSTVTTTMEQYQNSHISHDQTGQCEYLIVTLADSMLEPIIPKARESKKFIDK